MRRLLDASPTREICWDLNIDTRCALYVTILKLFGIKSDDGQLVAKHVVLLY